MSERQVIQNCSPTMAGLKTGSLFCCDAKTREELNNSVRDFNNRLVPKGVRFLPLRYRNGRALVYMYRPDRLENDLKKSRAKDILKKREYPVKSSELCIVELMKRIKSGNEFPHEIGLFLGYPPEDVDGFINNGAKGAKCVGTWKVYGDESIAKRTFAQYKKCTKVYENAYDRHKSLDRLVVSFQK